VTLSTRRLVSWVLVLFVAAPYALMLWWPDAFAASLSFALRTGLALVFPIFTHAYALWVVYVRVSNRVRPMLMAVCLIASIFAFAYLRRNYDAGAMLDVAIVPVLYVLAVLPTAIKQRTRGNT